MDTITKAAKALGDHVKYLPKEQRDELRLLMKADFGEKLYNDVMKSAYNVEDRGIKVYDESVVPIIETTYDVIDYEQPVDDNKRDFKTDRQLMCSGVPFSVGKTSPRYMEHKRRESRYFRLFKKVFNG